MLEYLHPFLEGLGISFGLIIAIGMQNSFILKQGILRNQVLLIVLFCSLVDAILITLGVNGLGALLAQHELLLKIFHWGGILFLFGYGTRAFMLFCKKQSMHIDTHSNMPTRKQIIHTLFIISFLNPSVYLDSCVVMASVSAHLSSEAKIPFTIGATLASIIWFFALGYGAQFLRPFFEKPIAWKVLDFIIGSTMYAIAISLLVQL